MKQGKIAQAVSDLLDQIPATTPDNLNKIEAAAWAIVNATTDEIRQMARNIFEKVDNLTIP